PVPSASEPQWSVTAESDLPGPVKAPSPRHAAPPSQQEARGGTAESTVRQETPAGTPGREVASPPAAEQPATGLEPGEAARPRPEAQSAVEQPDVAAAQQADRP